MDIAVFGAFIACQVGFWGLSELGRLKAFAIFQHIAKNHWVIWLFHPTVIEGVKAFVVHVVIYSGQIIHS